MPGDLHRYTFPDARIDEVPDSTATEVMECQPLVVRIIRCGFNRDFTAQLTTYTSLDPFSPQVHGVKNEPLLWLDLLQHADEHGRQRKHTRFRSLRLLRFKPDQASQPTVD